MKRRRGLLQDERGVEPTVMKILVGIILIAIGLGIGVTLYRHFGGAATHYLDFTVSVTPDGGTIILDNDNSIIASVSVESIAGYTKEVALSASGPSGITILFNEQLTYSDDCPFGVTMKVTVESGMSVGAYTITIKGTSEDGTKSTTYELTIEQAWAN